MMEALQEGWLGGLLLAVYTLNMLVLALFGLHRGLLLWTYHRSRPPVAPRDSSLEPAVLVQLPMYNEGTVARRIIEAAGALDWPRDRLLIQVLDDSDEATHREIVAIVEEQQSKGIPIELRHRSSREGFKAGALQAGLMVNDAPFVALFDADFLPPSDFLRRTLPCFADPGLGMVQARWQHLNRERSWLTEAQAVFLDGHFVIEHGARNRAGHWMNFNGTAGVWRRAAIESAGGWEHDTLTEDVDLSYRAQLRGWRFLYLSELGVPAELPPEINAFKTQQHRWTKGSIQTAFKLMPKILRAPIRWRTKVEAFFHLSGPMVAILALLMAALHTPALIAAQQLPLLAQLISVSLLLSTLSVAGFYLSSQRELGRRGFGPLLRLPMVIALGVGISLNNAGAAVEALLRRPSGFVRTPKFADRPRSDASSPALTVPVKSMQAWAELAMGSYLLLGVGLLASIEVAATALLFPLLFATGFLYVGGSSLAAQLRA